MQILGRPWGGEKGDSADTYSKITHKNQCLLYFFSYLKSQEKDSQNGGNQLKI